MLEQQNSRDDKPAEAFVGREQELGALQAFLRRATAGQGQIAFVAGEAGSGKSTLVSEFVRRAEEADPELVAAIGECNAQTGSGDPYLPFRQLLSALTGTEEEGQVANTVNAPNAQRLKEFVRISSATLLDIGPDLVGLFVPGASLLVKLATRAATNSQLSAKLAARITGNEPKPKEGEANPALDQERLFEQYTRVLQALAKDKTLILILDDLQWTDRASLDLLFHLTRQLKDDRVLILGTYRPDDVALGRGVAGSHEPERHPLEPLLNELKRYHGDIVVGLGAEQKAEGQAFVEALIDREPNLLGPAFRRALFERTDGSPLFTVELLRQLQERGDLVKDAQGRWVESASLNWDELPARVEGVIQERLARLSAALHEILSAASVLGLEFSAQAVARIEKQEERELIHSLARELDKRHRLVQEQGESRVGRQVLSIYRFGHSLFQQFLYLELSRGERRFLHADAAAALEALYDGHTDEIAPQLAHHYQLAGDDEKAVEYLSKAGDGAARAYALKEAAAYYTQALDLAARAELSSEQRTSLYTRRGRTLELDHKFAAALSNYDEMLATAQAEGDRRMELAGLLAAGTLRSVIEGIPDAEKGEALAAHALELARELNDRPAQARALWNLMLVTMYLKEDPARGLVYGEQSLALARELELREQLAYVTTDLAAAYTLTGRLEEAEARLNEGDGMWRELGNLPMLGFDLSLLMVTLVLRGKYETLSRRGAEARHDLDRLDTRWSQGPMLVFETAGLLEQGEFGRALAALDESLPLLEKEARTAFIEMARGHQFWAHLLAGDAETAREIYGQFHIPPARIGRHPYTPWVLGVYALYEIASGQLEAAQATLAAGAEAKSTVAAAWLGLARCQLAYARGDYRAATSLAGESIESLRGYGLMHLLADFYYVKGRAHIMLGEHGEAREALEAGRETAEALGARRVLWQILAVLADEEEDSGQAARLRSQARETVRYVAEHAGSVQEAFLALPAVRGVLLSEEEPF